jgi:hypothetical protein
LQPDTLITNTARTLLLAIVAYFGAATGAHAATAVSGVIGANTTWTLAQSPYQVTADVSVENGATLAIEPGVVVTFDAAKNLIVTNGALSARGTAGQPIVFTSTLDAAGSTPAPGDWGQIRFLDGTNDTATIIEHAQVRYGHGIDIQSAAPTFNYLQIANNLGSAIAIDLASSPKGIGNQASGNTLNGVSVPAGDVLGAVTWGIKGIPYVVASGIVSVGGTPAISTLNISEIQQGETVNAIISGTRLAGAQSVGVSTTGTTGIVQSGATDTSVPVQLTASPSATLGPASIELQVAAGRPILAGALQIIQPQPTVTGLSPNSVIAGQGGSALSVTGRNFVPESIIQIDGIDLTTTYTSANTLNTTLPALTAGNKSITVKQPDPLSAGSFLVSKPAVLAVTVPQLFFTPASVSQTQGIPFSLTVAIPYAAPAGGISINLASSATAIATVPASVTIPEGAVTGTVPVTSAGMGSAIITASYPGWQSAQASVSIFSSGLPPLLAEFRMDETGWQGTPNEVKDSTMNANHGAAANGAATAPSKLCAGGYFDGSASRYAALPMKLQDLAANTFTMMMWVKPGRTHEIDVESSTSTTGTSGQNYALFPSLNTGKWNWDTSGYAGAGISVGTNGISVYEHAGGYMPPVLVWAGTVSGNSWTHVAVTYNNGVPSLYVNGVFQKTGVKGSHANVVPPFTIGSPAYGNYSLGTDEYKVFGGVLSAADIATVYANESTGMNWDGTARLCASTTPRLSLSPASVSQKQGQPLALTVSIPSPAPIGGIAVYLTSSAPAIAGVPVSVVIPEGATSTTVMVNTTGLGNAIISASATGFVDAGSLITLNGAVRRYALIPTLTTPTSSSTIGTASASSSYEVAPNGVFSAFDNNAPGRWVTNTTALGHWLKWSFVTAHSVTEFEYTTGNNLYTQLQYSDDDVNWISASAVYQEGQGNFTHPTTTGATPHRFWRLYVSQVYGATVANWYGYDKFQLYSDVPLATTAIGSYSPSLPQLGTDGTLATGWNAGRFAPAWIAMDLGVVRPINEVRVYAGTGWPAGITNYDIQVSNDSISWTTVAQASNGNYWTITPVTATGRYVRLQINSHTGGSWIALYEFQVY